MCAKMLIIITELLTFEAFGRSVLEQNVMSFLECVSVNQTWVGYDVTGPLPSDCFNSIFLHQLY